MKAFAPIVLAVVCGTASCTTYPLSPSANFPTMESAAPAQGISIQGGGYILAENHSGAAGGVLSMRRGVPKNVELGAGVLRASTDFGTLVAGRAGGKWAPRVYKDLFAFTFGVGGGMWEPGAYLSPDLGFILSGSSGLVVPFISGSGFVSVPLVAREVEAVPVFDEEPELIAPRSTVGWSLSTGLEIQIVRSDVTWKPYLGASVRRLSNNAGVGGGPGLSAGISISY